MGRVKRGERKRWEAGEERKPSSCLEKVEKEERWKTNKGKGERGVDGGMEMAKERRIEEVRLDAKEK